MTSRCAKGMLALLLVLALGFGFAARTIAAPAAGLNWEVHGTGGGSASAWRSPAPCATTPLAGIAGESTRHEPDAPIRGAACVLAQAFPECKQVFRGQRACILAERTVAGDEGIPEVCEIVEIGRHVQ